VLDFLQMIEVRRGNHVSTRNQWLAALHTFYRYAGPQYPEMLAEAQRVEAIPMKRSAPPQTDYLERDEIQALFKSLPRQGTLSLRDQPIFIVLYNTGARVQEIADLRIADVDFDGPLRIRLHGKGDKWRSCPLWPETAELLKRLIADVQGNQPSPLFMTRQTKPLTHDSVFTKSSNDTLPACVAPLRKRNIAAFLLMSSAIPLQSDFWSRGRCQCNPGMAGTCQLRNDPANPYADYSVDHLYQFLSSYQLTHDISSKYEYSNLGGGLLGHVLARRAGTDYETLVRTRICEPLGMKGTAITLSSEMKTRFAIGHSQAQEATAKGLAHARWRGSVALDRE
jgi:hypothetical protein